MGSGGGILVWWCIGLPVYRLLFDVVIRFVDVLTGWRVVVCFIGDGSLCLNGNRVSSSVSVSE